MTVMEKYKSEATHGAIVAAMIMALIVMTRLTGNPPSEIPAAKNAAKNAPLTPPGHAQLPPLTPPSQSQFPPIATTVGVADAHATQVPAKHKTVVSAHSDPRKFSVGPNEIANRYTLLGVERNQVSPEDDELIVRLHIESLAIDPLVSPFESDMLEISVPGLQPIKPSTPFRFPLPSGSSRNQDIVFRLPPDFRLQDAALRIHYYNYQHEVPLSLSK